MFTLQRSALNSGGGVSALQRPLKRVASLEEVFASQVEGGQ